MRESICLPEGERLHTPENLRYLRSRETLRQAAERRVILEAPCVLCDCASMTLTVRLPDGVKGVICREDACWQPGGGATKDIAVITRVGKPVQFVIKGFCDQGNTAILSRADAQKRIWEDSLSGLRIGDIIPARITHLEPFGAFCDVGGGIISLLTVDRISVSRIAHPADRFSVGDRIYALLSGREDSGRLFLSHRELLGNWEENASQFRAGQTACGIIRSVESYGVFVELAPNLAGLAELYEGACAGRKCSVYIKSILPERMKVKLVLIDVQEEAPRMPLRYYIDPEEVKHLDRWQYSPTGCRKTVETVFCESELLSPQTVL